VKQPNFFRRYIGVAGSTVAAALLFVSPLSMAQSDPGAGTAALSTGATCAYTSVVTYPTGGLYVVCGTVAPPPAGTATVTLGVPSGTIDSAAGGSVTLAVGCSGTCSGLVVSSAVSPAYGGVSVTPSSLTFNSNSAQNITVTGAPGTAAGSASIALAVTNNGTATGVTLNGSPRGVTIGTSTPPPSGSCTTNADFKPDSTITSDTKFAASLKSGQTWALLFTSTRNAYTQGSITMTMPMSGTYPPSSYTVTSNISACPGDFTNSAGPNCGPYTTSRSTFGYNFSTYDSGKCLLDPSKTYYFNVRHTRSDGTTSCTNAAGCTTGVNLGYY
jgi:hypothetical protein